MIVKTLYSFPVCLCLRGYIDLVHEAIRDWIYDNKEFSPMVINKPLRQSNQV